MTRFYLRVHGTLQDFLPKALRGPNAALVPVEVRGPQSLKHILESLGIPHPEVACITHAGRPVSWNARPRGGEVFDVYPYPPGAAWPFDEPPRFIVDGHLGRLAAYLRLLGLDTRYNPAWDDPLLAHYAAVETRIVLTRDRDLLKRGRVRFGYWVRTLQPPRQLREVVHYFRLERWARPFYRCARCNTVLEDVPKTQVTDQVPPYVYAHHDRFRRCPTCGRVYWPGSHVARLERLFQQVLPP